MVPSQMAVPYRGYARYGLPKLANEMNYCVDYPTVKRSYSQPANKPYNDHDIVI